MKVQVKRGYGGTGIARVVSKDGSVLTFRIRRVILPSVGRVIRAVRSMFNLPLEVTFQQREKCAGHMLHIEANELARMIELKYLMENRSAAAVA